MNEFEKWYEKMNGPIDGWNDGMHEQEAAFEAGMSKAELRILELEQERDLLQSQFDESVSTEYHDRIVAEAMEGKTTGIVNAGAEVPVNGYVVLNNTDGWQKYSSLDELITEQVSFDQMSFNAHNSVYELGQQVRPTTSIKWEEVK